MTRAALNGQRLRDHHAAGLRHVLDAAAAQPHGRLTADLGPLPIGMAWTDLYEPEGLERFFAADPEDLEAFPAGGGTGPASVSRAMQIPEARAAIKDAVTAGIVAGFEYDLRRRQGHPPLRAPDPLPDGNPGHDPTRVPPVPAAVRLAIDYDSDQPDVLFTWRPGRIIQRKNNTSHHGQVTGDMRGLGCLFCCAWASVSGRCSPSGFDLRGKVRRWRPGTCSRGRAGAAAGLPRDRAR